MKTLVQLVGTHPQKTAYISLITHDRCDQWHYIQRYLPDSSFLSEKVRTHSRPQSLAAATPS